MVFGVGLDFFFADERKRHVVSIVRKQERLKFPENSGSSVIAYNFESLDFKASERKLNAFYAEFEPVPAEKVRPHQHPGVELLYMISGKLELIISFRPALPRGGGCVYFDSAVRHSYRRVGKNRCSAVIVTV